jgi:hypothetical protein
MSAIHASTIEAGVIVSIIVFVILATLGAALRHWLGGIKKQLVPNGGSSLRDAVNRVESAQIVILAAQASAALVAAEHGKDIAVVKVRLEDHIAGSQARNLASVAQAAAVALASHDERGALARQIETQVTP